MRCLVTGASGHLGAHVVRVLLAQGHQVTGFVRASSNCWRLADLLPQLELIRDDCVAVERNHAEVVFHLAWSGVTAGLRDDVELMQSNVALGLSLLEAARRGGCRCWVGLGSQAEYGPVAGVLREDLPLRPNTAYGAAKVRLATEAEQRCLAAGMRFAWLRLCAAYGPMDDERHLIPSVILKLLAKQKPMLTLGEQKWDYLYVDDAAAAICRVGSDANAHGTFNLAAGQSRRVREIVEMIRELIDPCLPLGFGELPDESRQLEVDIDRLTMATGWRPRVALRDGLQRTVSWYSARMAGQ